jgi:hypothetical protein
MQREVSLRKTACQVNAPACTDWKAKPESLEAIPIW